MNGHNALPITRIFDADFYFDTSKMEFRQVDDEKNSIGFSEIREQGEHDLIYDPLTKNVFKGTLFDMSDRDDLVLVKLPSLLRDEIERLTAYKKIKGPDLQDQESDQQASTPKRRRGRGI